MIILRPPFANPIVPSLNYPLKTSLVPTKGVGSATFTRTTTATCSGYVESAVSGDNQVLLTIPVGIPRFEGARFLASNNTWSDILSDGTSIPEATLMGIKGEVASTNLVVQSSDFNTTWTKGSGVTTINTNVVVAPDGTTTADKIVENTTVGGGIYVSSNSITVSGLSTISIYAKSTGENRYLGIAGFSLGSTGEMPVFNLDNGTVDLPATSTILKRATIESKPNGWYRCIATVDYIGTTSVTIAVCNSTTDNTVANYARTGDGTSGIYVWGAQLEALPMATSYIPTTTASVTRNADVLTFPNAGNVSDTAGTVLMEITPGFNIPNSDINGYSNIYLIDFGSNNGYVKNINGTIRRFDGTTVASVATTLNMGTVYKIGSRWGSIGQRNWVNGASGNNVAFDGSINSTTNMRIGGYGSSAGLNFGGSIKNLKIYKEALSDTKISQLTT